MRSVFQRVNRGVQYKKVVKFIRDVTVCQIKHENDSLHFEEVSNLSHCKLKKIERIPKQRFCNWLTRITGAVLLCFE